MRLIYGTLAVISFLHSGAAVNRECNAVTCTDCFRSGPDCAWCASTKFRGAEWQRCQPVSQFGNLCPKRQLFHTDSEPLLRTNKIEENLVSISSVVINLRLNSSATFPVAVLVPDDSRRRKENVVIIGWRKGKKPVDLNIDSDCRKGVGRGNKYSCKKIKRRQQATFEVSVTLRSCPSRPRGQYKLLVKIGKAKKIIKVEIRYACECRISTGTSKTQKKRCSYNSKRNIGDGNCVVESPMVELEPPPEPVIADKCMLPEEESNNLCTSDIHETPCSGNGQCICGQCQCDNTYYGRMCDCSDQTCPRYRGAVCGGLDHGVCECGQCSCNRGYTGINCGCPITNATCLSSDGKICNGNGYCICGECKCNRGFSGTTCETCPTCVPTCQQYKQCAECLAVVRSTMPRSMCGAVCKGKIPEYRMVDKIQETKRSKICTMDGMEGLILSCPLKFEVKSESGGNTVVELVIEKRKECMTSQKCRSNDHCLAENGAVCNGKGSCDCGFCNCQEGYSGETCEECQECTSSCEEDKNCAICHAFDRECKTRNGCENIITKPLPDLVGSKSLKKCVHRDSVTGCFVQYLIANGHGTVLYSLQKFECP